MLVSSLQALPSKIGTPEIVSETAMTVLIAVLRAQKS